MTATPQARPRSVDIAFWLWVVGAMLLIIGGLIAATANIAPAYRGVGAIFVVAGAGLAYLSGRCRNGDPRFRRAALALALAVVVMVGLSAVFGVVHVLSLLAVLPLVAGAVLMTRPTSSAWFAAGAQQENSDG
jgi:hypothetical protein